MNKINQMVKVFIFLIPVSVHEEKREKIYTLWNPFNYLFLLDVICTSEMKILKKKKARQTLDLSLKVPQKHNKNSI